MNTILERIEREAGAPGLVDLLSERLSPTDLQSLLLEVYRRRAAGRSPKQVLDEYTQSRFARPATISPRVLTEWERLAWSLLPGSFEPIALSPVCPLGTNSVVATVDQNKAVATIRHSEVVSDLTNVLALECALRRREQSRKGDQSSQEVHLAASHRLLRPQQYANKSLASHFSLFGLVSAGRDRGTLRFEIDALLMHLHFYIDVVHAFVEPDLPLRLNVTDFHPTPRYELLETGLLQPMRDAYPDLDCHFDKERTTGRGYYRDVCFHLFALPTTPDAQPVFLADGGSVDWNEKYLSNTKERLIISGIGSERVCAMKEEGLR